MAGYDGSETRRRLEKLGKWRSLFAGWQLGTRLDNDPECQAVRDHREVTMLLRTEVNAAGLLRNVRMAGVGADLCIAFWDGRSTGTAHMIDQARAQGIPVEVVGAATGARE